MSQSRSQMPDWLTGVEARALDGIDSVLFGKVRQAYSSTGRVYHTWQHILACLAEYRLVKCDAPRAVLLALLFHDAVYVPGAKDNEAQSADLAMNLLAEQGNIAEGERREIAQMILLTASHHATNTLSADAMRLLDIDLSVLGAARPIYQAYATGVRREFCPAVVSEFKFRIGRIKFLRAVQQQPHIFLTAEMRSRCEQAARDNITGEIAALEQEAGSIGRFMSRVV